MARIRSLKPEAFQSDTLSEVSLEAERTFYGLSTQADDRGRHPDKPAVINGALWAVRSEKKLHTAADLDNELAELEKVDAVCRYIGCDGKRYLHLVTWDDHQKVDRASKSRAPRCPRHRVADPDKDYCGKHGTEECPTPPQADSSPREASPNSGEPSGELPDPSADPIESSRDSREDSGSPREGSRQSPEPSTLDLGSRTLDRGPWIVDPGSVPPPAGTAKPRTPLDGKRINAGNVIAAYVDGAKEAGLPAPAESLRSRVGKQARTLLADKQTDHAALMAAAHNAGAVGWHDLAVQMQRDAVAAKPRESLADPRFTPGSGAHVDPNATFSENPKDVFG